MMRKLAKTNDPTGLFRSNAKNKMEIGLETEKTAAKLGNRLERVGVWVA